ncbi:MAG: hypothetical protein ABTQ25_14800 [Nitrosomonas ureae]
MTDSLKADVRFNIENEDEQKNVNLILSKGYVVPNNELDRKEKSDYRHKSPLTNAQFLLSPIIDEDGINIVGVFVSMNMAACVVGNNVLIENQVYHAARALLGIVKYNLLSKGLDANIVGRMKKDSLTFVEVTLTYLFCLNNFNEARTSKVNLKTRGTALKNVSASSNFKNKKKKKKKKVYFTGDDSDYTVYFRERDYLIKAYVKDGPTDKCFAQFPTQEIERTLYLEGASLLRVEIDLKGVCLKRLNRKKANDWRMTDKKDPYLIGLEIIRKYFRFDDNLRTRRPQPAHLNKLCDTDRELVVAHLGGKDFRKNPIILSKGSKLAQQKYASAVNVRVLDHVGIDLTLGWLEQSTELWPKLSQVLAVENLYEIPESLRKHSMCLTTLETATAKLDALSKQQGTAVTK